MTHRIRLFLSLTLLALIALAPAVAQDEAAANDDFYKWTIRGGIAQGGPHAQIQRPALNEIWSQAKLDEMLPPGMKPAELILRYTLGHPHCHTTIVGTCNHEHLAENIAAATAGPLSADLYQEVAGRVSANQ